MELKAITNRKDLSLLSQVRARAHTKYLYYASKAAKDG